jgi:hypothetical protein
MTPRKLLPVLLLVLLCSSFLAIRPSPAASTTGGSILIGDENAGLFNLTPGLNVQLLASMSEPEGVAVDSGGNFIVAQGASAPGVYRVLLNSTAIPIAVGSPFQFPAGIAIAESGNIIVADAWANAIYSVSPNGTVTTVFAGSPLSSPQDVAVEPSGYLLVADQSSGLFNVSTGTATNVYSGNALGVARDIDGNYVFTNYTGLYRFDSHTHATALIAGGFTGAIGVTIDSVGNYVVADRNASPQGTIYAVMRNGTKLAISGGGPLVAPMRVAIIGYVDAVSFAQTTTTTSSSTTSSLSTTVANTTSTSSASSTSSTTSSTGIPTTTTSSLRTTSRTPTTSTTSGGGSGIPEFPAQLGLVLLTTAVIVTSYIVARRVAIPHL